MRDVAGVVAGLSLPDAARKHDVPKNTVRRWVQMAGRVAKTADAGAGTCNEEKPGLTDSSEFADWLAKNAPPATDDE